MAGATTRATVAERAASAGGRVALEAFRQSLQVETKADRNDLVTQTDRDAQARVLEVIRSEFPDDAVVCEEPVEEGVSDRDRRETIPADEAAWVVDPIDGTANFVREMRFWATSVAALVDGDVVGGATYLPAEGDVFTAGPAGVARNGEPITVSDRVDPGTFAVGLIGRLQQWDRDRAAAVVGASLDAFGDVRRLGCMQGVLALVAAGSLEAAFMPTRPLPWDAVTGVDLIRRAGGTATDLGGALWTPASEGLVVSNGTAHEAVRATARERSE